MRICGTFSSARPAVLSSHTLQHAILRNPQVLCEATQRLSDQTKSSQPEVDWRGISAFRNVLVHSYFEIDFEVVWLVVQRDLPVLENAVRQILAQLPPDD
ncbi:MAG TPA: DUF86 domain-containing protein [Solibacterales bacterium]|nr:DUF86 domain-containing protein [Bryobacterales bacterium]